MNVLASVGGALRAQRDGGRGSGGAPDTDEHSHEGHRRGGHAEHHGDHPDDHGHEPQGEAARTEDRKA